MFRVRRRRLLSSVARLCSEFASRPPSAAAFLRARFTNFTIIIIIFQSDFKATAAVADRSFAVYPTHMKYRVRRCCYTSTCATDSSDVLGYEDYAWSKICVRETTSSLARGKCHYSKGRCKGSVEICLQRSPSLQSSSVSVAGEDARRICRWHFKYKIKNLTVQVESENKMVIRLLRRLG